MSESIHVSLDLTANEQKCLIELVQRGQRGDQQALRDLIPWFDRFPTLGQSVGNLANRVEAMWIERASGANQNPVVQQSTSRYVETLRRALLGDLATPLEQLLVDRIVVTWLQVGHADSVAGDSDFALRRQESAQRRHLAAIRTLALVRRLGLPTVQVNVAERQINVTG